MAKKSTDRKTDSAARKPAPKAGITRTSEVKNSPIPKKNGSSVAKAAATSSASQNAPREVTYQMICERAYFISISGNGGSEFDNWVRAERELRG